MRGTIANMWHEANDDGKAAMLRKAVEMNVAWSATFLDEDPVELDRYARRIGMVPVIMNDVDQAGMRDPGPGVAAPSVADQYKGRAWLCSEQETGSTPLA